MKKSSGLGIDFYDIEALDAEAKKIGFIMQYFPKIDSTMRAVEEYARRNEDVPMVALTDHQTLGVGRINRNWMDTPENSLLFSCLFNIAQEGIAVFADIVALTLCHVLRKEVGLDTIKIKYPNDIVCDDKKLGGILVKNIYNDKLEYIGTNAGVGLNIHYNEDKLDNFADDYKATSLDACTKAKVSRQKLLIEILRALRFLSTEIEIFEANSNIADAYNKKWRHASNMLGRKIKILKSDKIVDSGLVIDTAIGRGVELETEKGRKWISLFETEMNARFIN